MLSTAKSSQLVVIAYEQGSMLLYMSDSHVTTMRKWSFNTDTSTFLVQTEMRDIPETPLVIMSSPEST